MELGLFLARAWGLYLLLVGAAFLINADLLKRIGAMVKEEGFLIISGSVALVIGILAVLAYNVWAWDWRGLVTLFGWIALIKGVVRLAFPQVTQRAVAWFARTPYAHVWLVLILLIGVYLSWVGFTM